MPHVLCCMSTYIAEDGDGNRFAAFQRRSALLRRPARSGMYTYIDHKGCFTFLSLSITFFSSIYVVIMLERFYCTVWLFQLIKICSS